MTPRGETPRDARTMALFFEVKKEIPARISAQEP